MTDILVCEYTSKIWLKMMLRKLVQQYSCNCEKGCEMKVQQSAPLCKYFEKCFELKEKLDLSKWIKHESFLASEYTDFVKLKQKKQLQGAIYVQLSKHGPILKQ